MVLLLLLFSSILVANCSALELKQLENGAHYLLKSSNDLDWWETAVFYQIYPRSFMDTDGDGIGDLKGINQKLSHLKDAGITATWISPIFKSPQIDQGYDISDYRAIDSDYGSMADLEELIKSAKELGIKIILDFVPNHTSDEHEWFKKSAANEEGYKDYYIWRDKNTTSANGYPNNWLSNFKGSAWEYHEGRKQFYYHQFAIKQPDLNYRNPAVVKEIKDVLQFWLEKGVDGFRVDAVPYIFEDPEFKDEKLAAGYTGYDINDSNCLDHEYTQNLDETFDMIYQFRSIIDNYTNTNNVSTRVMMTEAYAPVEKQMLYYGTSNGSTLGAHFTFNFNLVSSLRSEDFTIDDIANSINKWLVYIPKGFTNNWVLGNHDNHRVATRIGKENVDGFNMLTAILPGVMVTYNGEEIGMEDGEVTCDEGKDPQAVKNCSTFAQVSRDFERTPFQWDNTTNGGFTTGKPWLPVSNKTKDVNLKAQNARGISSHYNVYKELLQFRKKFQKQISLDALSVIKLSKNVLQIVRHVDDEEYSLLFNIGSTNESINFYKTKENYVVSVASVGSSYKTGAVVDKLSLKPHESIIVQAIGTVDTTTTVLADTTTTIRVSTTTGHGGRMTVRAGKIFPLLLLFMYLFKLIMS